jgi:hypothetical protein
MGSDEVAPKILKGLNERSKFEESPKRGVDLSTPLKIVKE